MTPDEIKSLRDRLKMSQTKFASLVGVRQAQISQWETGKAKPSRLAELRLADIRKKRGG